VLETSDYDRINRPADSEDGDPVRSDDGRFVRTPVSASDAGPFRTA